MTTMSRSSGGSNGLTVPPGSGISAEEGTIATPMPAAASCAAVRGLAVRNASRDSTTPRRAANESTHAPNPVPWS
jgi:hypothetical protein